MLYTKVNSRVTREFRLSNSAKIEEHTRVSARECQLRCELYHTYMHAYSGVARPGPTRAYALPSTFQVLPSPIQQDSHDSISNWTGKQILIHYLS